MKRLFALLLALSLLMGIPVSAAQAATDTLSGGVEEEIFVSCTELPAFTGSEVTVSPVVSFRGRILEEGTDYTISWLNNVDAGKASGLIRGIGTVDSVLEGAFKEFPFAIAPADMADVTHEDSYTVPYAGLPVTCDPVFTYNGYTLEEGKDYLLSFEPTAEYRQGVTMTVMGKGNFTGSFTSKVYVSDAPEDDDGQTLPPCSIYGSAIQGTTCNATLITLRSEPSYTPSWSVSDTSIATVHNGEVIFFKPGMVTVTANVAGQTSQWNVRQTVENIEKAVLQGCRITPEADGTVTADPILLMHGRRIPDAYYEVAVQQKGDKYLVSITGNQFFTGMVAYWFDAETLQPCANREEGWYQRGESWGYWRDGAFLTGVHTIDGRAHRFSDQGVLQTGWCMEGWDVYYLPGRESMPKTVTMFYPLPAAEKPEAGMRLIFDLLPGEYTKVVIPMEDADADACIYRMRQDGSFEALNDTKIKDGSASVTILQSCTLVLAKAEKLPFTDVPEGDRFYPPVAWAFRGGVTTGRTDTEFRPKESCTRAQVVTFLWRAAGQPQPAITENPFTDVIPGKYYYKAVLWAVGEGITTGKTATTFLPDDTVKREQFVTFLWRYAGKPLVEGASPFKDIVNTNAYYYEPVLWACKTGITNGTGNAKFGVDVNCNRAQTVMFLYRFFEDKPVTTPGAIALSATSVTLSGEPYRLKGTVLPDMADNKTILWSSSDPAVVEVDENGLLTPTGIGQAVITAKCGSAVAYCTVTSVCPHDKEIVEYVPPTCTTPGSTEGSHCRLCGEVFSVSQEIPATGHNWVEANCTVPRHCTGCDLTVGTAPGHHMVNDTCTVCGYNRENARKEEIAAENKRYDGEVARITGSYDAQIELKEGTIQRLMDQYGVSYLSSESYYNNRANTLRSEINTLIRKLAYTTSQAEQNRIQREIDSKQAEATECLVLANAAKMKSEIPELKAAKTRALNDAKREHEQNLKAIEEKYA